MYTNDESCVMDQPTENFVVPVRMNTARNIVNKASNYNSGVGKEKLPVHNKTHVILL